MRDIEKEHGALMLMAKVEGQHFRTGGSAELLVIFGSIRARRGAELKVISMVEYKKPGTFVSAGPRDDCDLILPERLPGDRDPAGWEYYRDGSNPEP